MTKHFIYFLIERKRVFSLTRGIVECFNLLVFMLQVVHPGLALVAAFLKFHGYGFPNVFLTTHGCELALNIFFCPKTDECFRLNKAPVLCFASDQRNATGRRLQKLPREVVSMLVIVSMFRSSFVGSVIRYERLF